MNMGGQIPVLNKVVMVGLIKRVLRRQPHSALGEKIQQEGTASVKSPLDFNKYPILQVKCLRVT